MTRGQRAAMSMRETAAWAETRDEIDTEFFDTIQRVESAIRRRRIGPRKAREVIDLVSALLSTTIADDQLGS